MLPNINITKYMNRTQLLQVANSCLFETISNSVHLTLLLQTISSSKIVVTYAPLLQVVRKSVLLY